MNNQTAIIISGLAIALAIYMGLSSQKTEYEACVEHLEMLTEAGNLSLGRDDVSLMCRTGAR